jgi:hypothetical protein
MSVKVNAFEKKIHYGMLINEICHFLMQIFFVRVLPWVREEFFVTQFFSRKKFVFIRKLEHYLSENKGF